MDARPMPKAGRPVTHIEIKIGRDTLFVADNFVEPDEFEIVAYSHERSSVWRPAWTRLVERLRHDFGDKIEVK
jgi:hypothetical protein